jgi:hypothetical protein
VSAGSRPDRPRHCHVLAEDADLADAVPHDRRDRALEECTVPELSLPSGPWTAPPALATDGIGFLVLQGQLIRRVAIDGRSGIELLGQCDVMRPWQRDDAPTLPLESGWLVLEPARLAALDGVFTRRLGDHPELAGRLFERAVRHAQRLAMNMAILQQTRVDDRLHMLLWHLAGRWGRVRGDGVLLRLRLTHALLADLVAARRPTVTSALSELTRRGLIRAVEDGWLLAGEPPRRHRSSQPVTGRPSSGGERAGAQV